MSRYSVVLLYSVCFKCCDLIARFRLVLALCNAGVLEVCPVGFERRPGCQKSAKQCQDGSWNKLEEVPGSINKWHILHVFFIYVYAYPYGYVYMYMYRYRYINVIRKRQDEWILLRVEQTCSFSISWHNMSPSRSATAGRLHPIRSSSGHDAHIPDTAHALRVAYLLPFSL